MSKVSTAIRRLRIVVRGVVQGVGFRPFVCRVAQDNGLNGWVLNSTEGVVIEVEGEATDAFVEALRHQAPPLARIERLETVSLPPVGYSSFAIHHSEHSEGGIALVSPDVCICEDCRRELFDPSDRRFGYPFINCTNCGPRFTIVQDIPYDRPYTTMNPFAMCPTCQREYDDLTNRRFHAQPNACPACGPQVHLLGPHGEYGREAAIRATRALLRQGKIVAVKGLGGFHLACDATDEAAVAELRRRKGRAEKPFAVMVLDAQVAAALCKLSDEERQLLESPQRPIVLLRRRPGAAIAPAVAPRNDQLGVMLPYTPLHYLLLSGDMPPALVMTSGNLSEEPIATGNAEARSRLAALADACLLHDRDIHVRCDDSVTRVFAGRESVIRRSRGYAPQPVRLNAPVGQILACGAELKNTFCLTRDNYAFLSHHIGDLENAETLRSFEEGISHFGRLFRVTPEVVACDLHPNYLSTQYAHALVRQGKIARDRLVEVQHHHAHVASCMAENGLTGDTIGVAFDGTGLGPDGSIWGGEFLVASYAHCRRAGHLAYVPLPGGDGAIRRPYRMALSYGFAALGSLEPVATLVQRWLQTEADPAAGGSLPSDLDTRPLLSAVEREVLARHVRGGLGVPLTSSAGRLFDAVSSLVGLRQVVTYEGQAAIELEQAAEESVEAAYPLPVCVDRRPFVVDHRPLVRAVVADVNAGVAPGHIAAKFHNALAAAVVTGCLFLREETGLEQVVLSGGVFQNLLLLRKALAGLQAAGFAVYSHHQVPCNDGGVALGQAAIANARVSS